MTTQGLEPARIDTTKLGGKPGRPSSPPHPTLGFGGVIADAVQRCSDLPVISPNVRAEMVVEEVNLDAQR